jgi:GNAT superfamily N-acetyltransferase
LSIRLATLDDVDAVAEIAREGVAESGINAVFDIENAKDFFGAYVEYPEFDLLVSVNEDNEVGGFAQVCESLEMFEQPLCYVGKFWVRKADRRTWAARDLLEAVEQWASDRDCTAIYSTATGELSGKEQKLFENLLKSYGYRDVGPVMIKLGG